MSAAKPTRVAVDALPLIGARTGIGHVTAQLIQHLAPREEIDLVGYAISRSGHTLLDGVLPSGVTPAVSSIPARVTLAAWRHTKHPLIERWTGPVDLVHATNFVAPPSHSPVVMTIHDLTFERHPELCLTQTRRTFQPMIERAIERGATVHVVSDFVGREVEEVYRLPASRIVRVYAGVAPVVAGDGARGRAIAGTDRYVLALGTIEPRKNLPRLVQAFDQIASRDRDVRLVVAGADGWGIETFDDELARAEHGERIVRTGYVGDEARRDLLAGATVLAYPSLYEGFGHPPLEAMSNGVPVVAAAVGSLPEVLGDAALLVDPFDVEALADALEAACDDAMLRARLSELGPPRAARYTWPRAADEFVALYQRLARERST